MYELYETTEEVLAEKTISMTIEQYQEAKEDIRENLNRAAGSFIEVGRQLKQIRDSKGYIQGGYANLGEFAKAEYGMEKTAVSRFIAINEKFAIDGQIKEEYQKLGYSKLSEMLSLSDEECLLITEKTSRQDIRELNKFNREPLPEEQTEKSPLESCVFYWLSQDSKREELNAFMKSARATGGELSDQLVRDTAERLVPSGVETYRHTGVFMFFYEPARGIGYKEQRTNSTGNMDYLELLTMIYRMFDKYEDYSNVQEPEAGDYWCNCFGPVPKEPIPEEKAPEKEPQKEVKKEIKKEQPKKPEAPVNKPVAPAQLEPDLEEKEEAFEEEKEDEETEPDKELEAGEEELETLEEETAETDRQEVVDNPRNKLIKEAESIFGSIDIYGWDDDDEPVDLEELKKTKDKVDNLAAVLDELLREMEASNE